MGNQFDCFGCCPRDDDNSGGDDDVYGRSASSASADPYGRHHGGDDHPDFDDTAPLIRDSSGVDRNGLGSFGSYSQSYDKGYLSTQQPASDGPNAEEEQQQGDLADLVSGFTADIVDNGAAAQAAAAAAAATAAAGGAGNGGGGGVNAATTSPNAANNGNNANDGPEMTERAVGYGKRLTRRAQDMARKRLPAVEVVTTKAADQTPAVDDVSSSQVDSYLGQKSEAVLSDADQVLVSEVAARAKEVISQGARIRVGEEDVAMPYGEDDAERNK